jgi:hypothetical protein
MERSQTELPHPLHMSFSRWLTEGHLQVEVPTSEPEEPSPSTLSPEPTEEEEEFSEEEGSVNSSWNIFTVKTGHLPRLRSQADPNTTD